MRRKLKWQIPGEPLAARYNWCQGPVPGRCPAVEKHWSVALVIQHAMRMRGVILSSVACTAVPCFATLSHKRHDVWEKLLNTKCVFWFSLQRLSAIYLNVRRTERHVIKKCILVFMWNWNFLDRFSKNTQIWNFIKIRPVGTELLLADRRAGQTDRRTDRHFAKCPNHWHDNLVHNVLFDKWANKIWQDWERLRKQNKWLWHAVICETGEMASLNTS